MFSSEADFNAVKTYLESTALQGKLSYAPNMESVTIEATVGELEEAFNVEFYDYVHKVDERITARIADGALPSELEQHIDTHSGFNRLPVVTNLNKLKVQLKNRVAAAGEASPQLIWKTYGISSQTVGTMKATQDIFASLGQSFSPADLAYFQQQYGLPPSKVQNVFGPNSPSSCASNPNNCVEASLDVQQITSTAQGTNTSFWSISTSINDIFLDWINAVAGDPNAPLVHSISYGSLGPEDPKANMDRFNVEVCKMGLRGLTILVATGDDGVANFQARSDPSKCGFTPSFPATSPYVLAVGATQGPESGQPEIACSSATGGGITSGGGFSDTFGMPSYQTSAVQSYVSNGPNVPPTSQFNTSGRAYPDVAFLGHNFPIAIANNIYHGSGTSASSPSMAAVITLINGMRLQAGKGPVGFVNPVIYSSNGKGFNDITSGENNCCAGQKGSAVCCKYGFTAATGWDPVTGWGSPNFPALSAYLTSL